MKLGTEAIAKIQSRLHPMIGRLESRTRKIVKRSSFSKRKISSHGKKDTEKEHVKEKSGFD